MSRWRIMRIMSVLLLSVPLWCATFRHGRNGQLLPDPLATPGATVTTKPADVCAKGYSAKVRHQVRLGVLKRAVRAYGVSWNARRYQADHLVSLELGGAPNDPRNIWPEPIADAKRKDRYENELHRAVCRGAMSLQEAQRRILLYGTVSYDGKY